MTTESSDKTILIVDDNPEIIHILFENLESDYEVLFATDGTKALHLVDTGNHPDLILLDIQMPDMSGYEVCKRLKQRPETRDIPIIFITALEQEMDEAKGLDLGAVDFVSKPFSIPVVRSRINAALRLKEEMDKQAFLAEKLEDLNRHLEHRVETKTSELKKAYHHLSNNEKKYRNILNNIQEGYYEIDLEGNFTFFNPAMVNMLGYEKSELLGLKYSRLTPDNSAQKLFEVFNSLYRQKKPIKQLEIQFISKKGVFLDTEGSVNLLKDNHDKIIGFHGMIRDITSFKKAQKKNRKLQSQLLQAQKMEAIGTLAGGIAHDFNNILSGIFGYSQLAQNHLDNPAKARHDIDLIMQGARKATELVQQILTFSRKSIQKKQPFSVYLIIKEALKLLRATIPTTIDIKDNIVSKATIKADSTKIHQVIMNLCTNAYHAMKETRGTLTVTLEDIILNESDCYAYPNAYPGKYLKLSVEDTGHGMDEQTVKKIFEPYFTTKEPDHGTGLGLAVVMGIVEEHNGIITVKSELGKGTVFNVFLPTIEKKAVPEIKEESSDHFLGSETILLIDDEKDLLFVVTEQLKDLGYRIIPFHDAKSALKIYTKNPDKFDIVITDMTMPEMTGTDLLKEIQKIQPSQPVILCTGHSDDINRKSAKKMGFKDYYQKPVVIHPFAEMIRKALGSQAAKQRKTDRKKRTLV